MAAIKRSIDRKTRNAALLRVLPRWFAPAALVVTTAAALVINWLADWILFSGGVTSGTRSVLRAGDSSLYERMMFDMPLVALGLLLGAAAMWGVAEHARPGLAVVGRDARWRLVAMAGFLLLVSSSRWMGFVVARNAEWGSGFVKLGPVPYANAILGFCLLASGILALRGRRNGGRPWPDAITSAGAAAALIIAPLWPLAFVPLRQGALAIDLVTLSALATSSPSVMSPQRLLGVVSLLVWTVLLSCGARLWLSAWTTGPSPIRQWWSQTLLAIAFGAAAIGLILAVTMHVVLAEVEADAQRTWNLSYPLGLAVALAGTFMAWRRDNRPKAGYGSPDRK